MQQNFELNFNPDFKKSFKRFKKNNLRLAHKIEKILVLLKQNPFYNSLISHRVATTKYGICQSSRVTSDLRILWEYNKSGMRILDILDIGGHSGKNKVY